MSKKTMKKAEEPTTLSGVYDVLMQGLNEAIEGFRGERQLRSVVRSTDDQWYADPDAVSASKESAPVVSLPLKPTAKQ